MVLNSENRRIEEVRVLDHGYVRLIETWGSDERIIEAAKQSTDGDFVGWDVPRCSVCRQINPTGSCINGEHKTTTDANLLRHLYTHSHMTPFEMAGMIIEVQAPIFVFREWHRHRTQSYNEMSARYMPLPDVNYTPTIDRILQRGGSNKQAQSTGAVATTDDAEGFVKALDQHYRAADALYRLALGASGIPKELARLVLPVGRYSRMRASANLRNWLGFLTLRMASDAQWEIRQYANIVAQLVSIHFPRTYLLFQAPK